MKSGEKNRTTVTLAVLPFENLTGEGEFGLFCRSFWLDLITELSRFRQFTIIAEQSVKKAVSSPKAEISFEQLHTDYYITGTVRS